jgi:ABC-type transporter Mla maintaining outer membrane lipid asymmetry ATPase subunit MlaF
MNLASNGKGFIVVTHEIFDALSLALRFMFLKDGEIVFDGDKNQFINSKVPQVEEFLDPYRYIIQRM